VDLNPREVNELHEQLFKMGRLLQGDNALSVLDDGYRPWVRPRQDDPTLATVYQLHDDRLHAAKESLREYENKDDAAAYTVILKEVLKLAGEGIQESLTRTMGDYLDATKGAKANSQHSEKDEARTSTYICTNNPAERPFAVIKALAHQCPSMSLINLSHVAHARVNGTFRMADTGGKTAKTKGRQSKAGVGLTADKRLRAAVARLCCVRKKSEGAATKLKRADYVKDLEESAEERAVNRKANLKEKARLMKNRAETANVASQAALVATEEELQNEIKSRSTKKSMKVFLTLEIDARVGGRNCYKYPHAVIGLQYRLRTKGFPLKKTPPKG
jgi:hypothetical protein